MSQKDRLARRIARHEKAVADRRAAIGTTWLEEWFFDRVLDGRPAPLGRLPMYSGAVVDPDMTAPPWSAVAGAMVRHEGFNWQRTWESLQVALARGSEQTT